MSGLQFSKSHCDVLNDITATQITVFNIIYFVDHNNSVAKFKLSSNFIIIRYDRQMRFGAILESESATESWVTAI